MSYTRMSSKGNLKVQFDGKGLNKCFDDSYWIMIALTEFRNFLSPGIITIQTLMQMEMFYFLNK